jgi:glutamine amidotransferase
MKRTSKKAIIIDYEMGNLFSVKLALEKVGFEAVVSNNKAEIYGASALVLPGVGAFGDAMEILKKLDLVDPIKEFINSGKPFLGICLGMQLLMTESEEFGIHKGLDIIKGRVVKFPPSQDKVPQVGWNRILKPNGATNQNWNNTLLKGLSEKDYMYFVHSFYVSPDDKSVVLSETNYAGLNFCSSIQEKNVFACQFHPEKSGIRGLKIYKNFYSKTK